MTDSDFDYFSSLIGVIDHKIEHLYQGIELVFDKLEELEMEVKKPTPYNKRETKSAKKAFESTEKSVKPVAKDTNKTRRKETKARLTGPTVKAEKPKATSMNPRGVNKHGK